MNVTAAAQRSTLVASFVSVRSQSRSLVEPLTPEDMMVQSCPEASPAKWHLAHTAWFFETFLLRDFLAGYRTFHPDFLWLFNSYYNSVSDQPEKKLRACFSRPGLEEILAYRSHVDDAMLTLLNAEVPAEAAARATLGLHHEQQHQELLLTDVKHAFFTNPLHPVYCIDGPGVAGPAPTPLGWAEHPGGLYEAGHEGAGFCFDNELPRHCVYLAPFRMASRLSTCAEYLAFMEDGGYLRPELWLSDGWSTVQAEGWQAPLYWRRDAEGDWSIFTLRGPMPLAELLHTPVCHISYYEADAFARWAGQRLPTEFEWEIAAGQQTSLNANLLERGILHPSGRQDIFNSMCGDVWQWTQSAYLGYPGYSALPGALGEYNGKFMSGHMVLRGGSCITPASHIRTTYRNFFSPATRWQFSGVRLAQR